jgi:phage baseplate assembly protein gpV
MNDLFETLRKLVRDELSKARSSELALVQEVFTGSDGPYEASVVLRDSALVLEHVPLLTWRKGLASVPDVGDLVLVQFVGGDLNRPVIVGSLYNDEQPAPENAEKQMVLHLPAAASNDEALRVVVSEASPAGVKLTLGSALELTLSDDDPVVKIDVGGNASVSIERSGAVTLESKGDLTLKGSANVSIEAGAELKLKGSIINLN